MFLLTKLSKNRWISDIMTADGRIIYLSYCSYSSYLSYLLSY